MKVHETSVTCIKIIDYNDRLDFLTTSEDKKVKIFSLQKYRGANINVHILGVIDLLSNSASSHWRFAFDNTGVIVN